MSVPSIKGAIFAAAPEDLKRLLSEGQLKQSQLEERLNEDDLKLLDEGVVGGLWYPVGTYTRMAEILKEVEGAGRDAYLVDRGAGAARRILEAGGVYKQFVDNADKWGERLSVLIVQMGKMVFNFTEWTMSLDDDRNGFRAEVTQAEEMPEVLRFGAQGFILALAEHITGRKCTLTSERPEADRIVYQGKLQD